MADGWTADEVHSDLVAYLLVVVPDVAALTAIAPALIELTETVTLRLLDVVVITKDIDGALEFLELADVDELAGIRPLDDGVRHLLTERDIELMSFALEPGTTGLVLLTEDRWAEPLAGAARRVGGHIIAGERIPASRIEAVVHDAPENPPGG
jgi:hypothetical protein